MGLSGLDLLGFAASALTSCAFLPQVWHTWRSRDVSGISLASYAVFSIGVVAWLVYGIWRADLPIIVANSITAIVSLIIVVMKIRFQGGKR
jgi:MtN3 and saliva related transmembrane protein